MPYSSRCDNVKDCADNSDESGCGPCNVQCEHLDISQCSSQSYSMTGFPNFFGHLNQAQAAEYADYIDVAEVVNCSKHSTEFLCGLLLPECREDEGFILPSRQICHEFYNGSEFYTGCGDLLRKLENSEEFLIDCERFPENPVPVCSANSSEPTTEVDDSGSGKDKRVFFFVYI